MNCAETVGALCIEDGPPDSCGAVGCMSFAKAAGLLTAPRDEKKLGLR